MAANLEDMLRVVLLTPKGDPRDEDCIWGAPTILWGPPGIGKSGRIEQVSNSVELPCETVYLATHQPEDISGVPMGDGKGDVTTFCNLPQVKRLLKTKVGTLFLDELSLARPAMQGAGLSVVYERFIAGDRMPPRIRVLAAANAAEDAAGGWALSAPMANRLLHIDVKSPTVEEWGEYMMVSRNKAAQSVVTLTHAEQRVRDGWSSSWPKYVGLVFGFLKHNRDKFYKMPERGNPQRGRAWASPRSWDVLTAVLTTCETLGQPELALEFIGACVGPGIGEEWAEWISKANLPDPQKMLDHGWTPDKRRLDIAIAAYTSVTMYVLDEKDKNKQKDLAVKCWLLFHRPVLHDNMGDIVKGPAKKLMQAGYLSSHSPEIAAANKDVVMRLGLSGLASIK